MIDANEKLGAHEVAAWLRRHPNFLKQFPDLAVSLVVPREEGPAASLASYQLEVLRDKNRELSRRLQELFGNAQENERLAVRTHQLALGLMRQDSAAGTLRAMTASLAEDFQGDLVRIVTFAPVDGLDDVDWWRAIPEGDIVEAERVAMEVLWALLAVAGQGRLASTAEWLKKIDYVLAAVRDGRVVPEDDFSVVGIARSGVVRVPPNRVNDYEGI